MRQSINSTSETSGREQTGGRDKRLEAAIKAEMAAVADPDISFGGHEAPRSSAAGAEDGRMWGGGGYAPSPEIFFNLLLKNGVFWSILMSKCTSHVYTCIAYFHFHQYKPTSYNYARVKTSY